MTKPTERWAKGRYARPVEDKVRVDTYVREFRLAEGLTLHQLSGLARVGHRSMQRAEWGEIMSVNVGSLLRIANALGVSVSDCFPILGPTQAGAKRLRDAAKAQKCEAEAERAQSIG